jgi:hypothetical protein
MSSEKTSEQSTGWVRKIERKGDEGFIVPLLLARAVGDKALSLLRHKGFVAATLVSALAGGGLAVGAMIGDAEYKEHANLEASESRATVELLDFDEAPKISVARAYFQETLDARHIEAGIIIDSPVVDVIPDLHYELNKQLDGVGVIDFGVPLDALRQSVNAQNKIDITIDPGKLEQTRYWYGAGPEVRDYTMDGGRQNFGDREGARKQILALYAATLKATNLDKLANSIDDIDAHLVHDLKRKGLQLFAETCNTQIDARLRQQIVDAVRAVIAALGRTDDIGDITFAQGSLTWKDDVGPANIPALNEFESYKFKDFKIDGTQCVIDPRKAGVRP